MEVSKLCFICFREGSLNSNEIHNSVVPATQEYGGVVGVRGLGGKFSTHSRQYLSLNDPNHHHGREEQEVSPNQGDFGFVCGECEPILEEFCEMYTQHQDLLTRMNGKVGTISEMMTKAEHGNERKEEFEAYQRCLQLQRSRRGQSYDDLLGFRKDFLERVQIRNLVSKQTHPVPDGSVSSGSSCGPHNNEIVGASSYSSFVMRVQSAPQPSVPDSDGNGGSQTLCFIPSATSVVSCKNETLSRSLEDTSAGIAEKSLLASSNSTAKRPIRKRTNLLQRKRSRARKRLHVCETCGKGLTTRWGLKIHFAVVHMGEKPYKCQYCEKVFSYRGGLRVHEKKTCIKRRELTK